MKNEKLLDKLAHKIDEALWNYADNVELTIQEASYVFNIIKELEANNSEAMKENAINFCKFNTKHPDSDEYYKYQYNIYLTNK